MWKCANKGIGQDVTEYFWAVGWGYVLIKGGVFCLNKSFALGQ